MAQKRRSSSTRTSTAKRAKAPAKETKAQESARHQTAAVLLCAIAILLLCVVIIPGEAIWNWMHSGLLGLFGLCAYVLPVLIGFLGVESAMEKPIGSLKGKVWQCIALLVMLGSAIQIFMQDVTAEGFIDALRTAYISGVERAGGGALGAIFSWIFQKCLGNVGAKIVIILVIVVVLMLVTGTTVIALLKALIKPVQKTKESLTDVMATAVEQHNAKKEAAEIDVDLGTGYPDEVIVGPEKDDEPRSVRKKTPEPVLPISPKPEKEKEKEVLSAADVEKAKEEMTAEIEKASEKKPEENDYAFPPLSLLNESGNTDDSASLQEQNATAELLIKTLNEFGVSAKVIDVSHGPSVTRYELQPSAGVKISKITGLADDIALRLATTGVRIEAPIPNKAAIGIEVPNRVSGSVCLRDLIGSKEFKEAKSRLTVALGKDIAGQIVLADLAKMPHLLIAGTTGSGKSVCTNSMIQSVLFKARPDEVKLLLIDPKQVEFGVYNGIPHLLVPVVTEPRKAAGALGWAVNEMLRRYKLFTDNAVRDLTAYNEMARKNEMEILPQVLIVIDEFADLMMVAANEVESNVCRLAQMARAAGMHLVIATQRPSVDVITGLIKANIPSRLALTVASAVDSRTILDTSGAEKLLGKGDMLFQPVGYAKPLRVQGCFVGNREVESVVDFLKSTESHQYDESVIEEIDRQAAATEKSNKGAAADGDDDGEDGASDEMLMQAIEAVVETGTASTSFLQRRLRLGYARAGRIIDEMEKRGVVGPYMGSKPRQVLITRQQWLEMNMNRPDEEPSEEEL